MKKFLLLFMGIICSLGMWADDAISCSAYLSATAGSPTTTNCSLTFYKADASQSVPAGIASGDYYYSKMNGDTYYYVVTLNQKVGETTYAKFKAGDKITLYLYANGSTIAYKIGSSAMTACSESKTKGSVYATKEHTLTASEIESDGTLRIYRNSSNTFFAGISITGTRAISSLTESDLTLTSDNNLVLGIGKTSQITYTTSSDGDMTYTPADEKVVTVSSTGLITGVAGGHTTIEVAQAETSTYEGATKTITVDVPYDATTGEASYVLNNTNYGFSSSDSKTYYFKNGFTMTNTAGKSYGYAALDNNTGMKFSAGTEYVINIPEGITVYYAKVKARNNYDTGNSAAQLGTVFGKTFTDDLPYSSEDAIEETINLEAAQTGGTLSFTPAGNQVQMIIELFTSKYNPYTESTTIFTANAAKKGYSVEAGAAATAVSSDYVTVSGGSMTVSNGQADAKTLTYETGKAVCFGETNGNTFFGVTLTDNTLKAGDVLSAYVYTRTDNAIGLNFSTSATYTSTGCIAEAEAQESAWVKVSYTVAEGDGICGESSFNVFRSQGKTTYFKDLTISRPATVSSGTLNAKGYATFSSAENVLISGAQAYTAELEGTTITCHKIENNIVPAYTGVILYSETASAPYTALYQESADALTVDNDLKATTTSTGLAAYESSLVLSGNTFVTFSGDTFTAGKAYFPYTSGSAKAFTIVFDDNEATAINAVSTVKAENNVRYNLAGQRVNATAKGIVIMNGKKYLNK